MARLNSLFWADIQQFLSAAFAQSTWRRHEAALNSCKQFDSASSSSHLWPLSSETLQSYTSWAFTVKDLKSFSVETYLSSLKCIHSLQNLSTQSFDSYILKTMIGGKENMEIYSGESKTARKVMTLDLLKLLGHEISKTNWSQDSKQVVWGACTLAFFGCFRMGELLPQNENSFNKDDTLLWKDLKFNEPSHILVHIKTPKSRLPHGEYVDIFSFTGHSVCPVRAMSILREQRGIPDPESPVFRFSTGTCLTRRLVNSILPELLKPHIGSESANISGQASVFNTTFHYDIRNFCQSG